MHSLCEVCRNNGYIVVKFITMSLNSWFYEYGSKCLGYAKQPSSGSVV
jgi:hypothetical protein